MKAALTLLPLFFFLCLSACSHAPASEVQSDARSVSSVKDPSILVIGDSNLVGAYGDVFHAALLNWHTAEIYSIAIGGASAAYYLRPLANICCGYKVRESARNASAFSIVESSNVKNGAAILARYHSSLREILNTMKPNLLVISLGSNATGVEDHISLLAQINAFNPKLPIYWVGPPAEAGTRADDKIKQALARYPGAPYYFFSSQNVAAKFHMGAADSTRWVNAYIGNLKQVPFYMY